MFLFHDILFKMNGNEKESLQFLLLMSNMYQGCEMMEVTVLSLLSCTHEANCHFDGAMMAIPAEIFSFFLLTTCAQFLRIYVILLSTLDPLSTFCSYLLGYLILRHKY